MDAWGRHLERHNPYLIWRHQLGNNYGDWLQIGEETRKDVLATAYFARSAQLTGRALQVLGREAEAVEIAELAHRVGCAFRREFLAADGTVAGDTQGGYLLTLACDLCESAGARAPEAQEVDEAGGRRAGS